MKKTIFSFVSFLLLSGSMNLFAAAQPASAPAVPSFYNKSVTSLYLDASASTALNFGPQNWGCTASILNFDGNNVAYYSSFTWDCWTNWGQGSYDVSSCDYFHADLWTSVDATIKISFEDVNTNTYSKEMSLVANQWNAIDLKLSEAYSYNFKDMKYFKLEGFSSGGSPVAVDNLFFYKKMGPTTAAPTPTYSDNLYCAVYSTTDSYGVTDLTISDWGSGATINMDEYGACISTTTNPWYTIVADKSVANMDKLHMEIWTDQACTFDFGPFNSSASDTKPKKQISLSAGQWNTIEIDLFDANYASFATLWKTVSNLIIENLSISNSHLWFNNIFFVSNTPDAAAAEPSYIASVSKTIFSTAEKYGKTGINIEDRGSGAALLLNSTYGAKITLPDAAQMWYTIVADGGLDCSQMDTLRFDVWSATDFTMEVGPYNSQEGSVQPRHQVSITGGEWNVVKIAINNSDWSSFAPYWNNLSNLCFESVSGTRVMWINNVIFYPSAISISEDKDNQAYINDNDLNGQIVNVKLGRTFTADGYNYTLCLPFAMTSEQIASAFGACTINRLADSYLKGETLYLEFDKVTETEAGVAYLFCPEATVENAVINGVTLNATAPASSAVGEGNAKFVGVYAPKADLTGLYLLGEENWLQPAGEGEMYALRGYFDLSSAPAHVQARAVFRNQPSGLQQSSEKSTSQKVMRNGVLYIYRNGAQYSIIGQPCK